MKKTAYEKWEGAKNIYFFIFHKKHVQLLLRPLSYKIKDKKMILITK